MPMGCLRCIEVVVEALGAQSAAWKTQSNQKFEAHPVKPDERNLPLGKAPMAVMAPRAN